MGDKTCRESLPGWPLFRTRAADLSVTWDIPRWVVGTAETWGSPAEEETGEKFTSGSLSPSPLQVSSLWSVKSCVSKTYEPDFPAASGEACVSVGPDLPVLGAAGSLPGSSASCVLPSEGWSGAKVSG